MLVMGTTGEANNLTVTERKQLAEKWISSSRGRLVSLPILLTLNAHSHTARQRSHKRSTMPRVNVRRRA